MNKTITRLAAAAAAAASLALIPLATASSASAAVTTTPSGTNVSPNWAGYYAVPVNGKGPEGVFATFTVPKVSCKRSIGPNPTYGAIWASIGGMGTMGNGRMGDVRNGKQAWLEQDGIDITCKTRGSQPVYHPFWEIVRPQGKNDPYGNPYDSMIFQDARGHDVTVKPGDQISLSVLDNSTRKVNEFGFSVTVNRDSINGGVNYFKQAFLPLTAYTGRTAEVITEHPLGFSALQGDLAAAWLHETILGTKAPAAGLVDMGEVRYSEAMYLTHLPGQTGYPAGVAVAQYKAVLDTWLETNPYHQQQVVITPSRAYVTIPGNTAKDGFFTHYITP